MKLQLASCAVVPMFKPKLSIVRKGCLLAFLVFSKSGVFYLLFLSNA